MRRSRRGDVAPFIVMDVMQAAARLEAEGADVVHMEVGQPGAAAPAKAREAAAATLRSGDPMGYTVALGIPELRARIAHSYAERHGVEVSPERVVVTTGSSAGFLLSFLALFDAGGRVAVAEPGYPSYRNILKSLDLEPVGLPCGPETDFKLTPEALDAAAPLDGVLSASPANPTGAMLSREETQALIDWCSNNGAAYISDEIYDGLYYGAPPTTALTLTDDAVIINSFSKYHCMTGWRIGWMVVPEGLLRQVERLGQNHFICPPAVSQIAALAALDADEELQAHLRVYARNRDLILEAAPKLGLNRLAPADGAFYIYADIAAHGGDSGRFCADLLAEAHVAVTPGMDFDPVRGGDFIRFSYAGPTERIEEGLRRMAAWIGRRDIQGDL